jgi:hypothetical protein
MIAANLVLERPNERLNNLTRCPMTALGHKRTWAVHRHVRYFPKSGHCGATVGCPLCANSGLMHRSSWMVGASALAFSNRVPVTRVRWNFEAERPGYR